MSEKAPPFQDRALSAEQPEAELSEYLHLCRAMMTRGEYRVQRKKLVRPVGEEFDQATRAQQLAGAQGHDLCTANGRMSRWLIGNASGHLSRRIVSACWASLVPRSRSIWF